MNKAAYDLDFYGWANGQAQLLREGRLNEADIADIAGEIESMGRSEKRERVNGLAALLKWRVLPAGRGSRWRANIIVQRGRSADLLEDNPSLKPRVPKAMTSAYDEARLIAGYETKLGETAFPLTAPWSFDDVMNPDYWPN